MGPGVLLNNWASMLSEPRRLLSFLPPPFYICCLRATALCRGSETHPFVIASFFSAALPLATMEAGRGQTDEPNETTPLLPASTTGVDLEAGVLNPEEEQEQDADPGQYVWSTAPTHSHRDYWLIGGSWTSLVLSFLAFSFLVVIEILDRFSPPSFRRGYTMKDGPRFVSFLVRCNSIWESLGMSLTATTPHLGGARLHDWRPESSRRYRQRHRAEP